MILERIIVGPLEVNCYILGCEETRDVFIVDPGDDLSAIQDTITDLKVTPRGIINTHGHIDHAGGVAELMKHLNLPFYIHRDEMPVLQALDTQSNQFGLFFSGIPEPTGFLDDDQMLEIGEKQIRVIHTPGHSPGGICLLCEDCLISGDTLFSGSIGRSDLPGGNGYLLIDMIKTKLLILQKNTRVYPGHGPSSTIEREIQFNPFLK